MRNTIVAALHATLDVAQSADGPALVTVPLTIRSLSAERFLAWVPCRSARCRQEPMWFAATFESAMACPDA